MALDVEVIGHGTVACEEALCRSGRPEAELLALSAPGRLMRDLRPVVRAPAGDVAIGEGEITQGGTIRPKSPRDDAVRGAALPLQQFSQQFQCCLPVALRLNEDFEHLALIIDGAPQIHSLPGFVDVASDCRAELKALGIPKAWLRLRSPCPGQWSA